MSENLGLSLLRLGGRHSSVSVSDSVCGTCQCISQCYVPFMAWCMGHEPGAWGMSDTYEGKACRASCCSSVSDTYDVIVAQRRMLLHEPGVTE